MYGGSYVSIPYIPIDYVRAWVTECFKPKRRWRCERQITTRRSVSSHSTKYHHIKMCARKIKANELLVAASSSSFNLVVADTKCIWCPHTRKSCVHFTFPQDVWPLIVLVGSDFPHRSLEIAVDVVHKQPFLHLHLLDKSILFSNFPFIFQCFPFCYIRCNNVASHLCFRNAKYNNNDYNLFEELFDELETKTNAL